MEKLILQIEEEQERIKKIETELFLAKNRLETLMKQRLEQIKKEAGNEQGS